MKSVSLAVESEIRAALCTRRDRAISAVLMARRLARAGEFYVAPSVASRFRLSPRQLGKALDSLEGVLIETVESKRGRHRRIRLLPEWEPMSRPG